MPRKQDRRRARDIQGSITNGASDRRASRTPFRASLSFAAATMGLPYKGFTGQSQVYWQVRTRLTCTIVQHASNSWRSAA